MAGSCEVLLERVQGLQQLLHPCDVLLQPGDPLPPLWHWVALPRWSDPRLTGHDGHPQRPDALADGGVRRMFAGGQVEFEAGPLRIGERVWIGNTVAEITAKSGRSGDFLLATFVLEVHDEAGLVRIRERQNVVYIDPRPSDHLAPSGALPIAGHALRASAAGGFDLHTDPTLLLRFSALTANAHRIHYDLPYAQEVEKLPGLLVHGPLLTIALAHAACAAAQRVDVVRVEHRNLNPLFCGQPAHLDAALHGSEYLAHASCPGDDAGGVKARLRVEFAATEEGTR